MRWICAIGLRSAGGRIYYRPSVKVDPSLQQRLKPGVFEMRVLSSQKAACCFLRNITESGGSGPVFNLSCALGWFLAGVFSFAAPLWKATGCGVF